MTSARATVRDVRRTITRDELERPLVPYEEAVEKLRASFAPLEAESVPLSCALGRAIADDVRAPFDVPGFDNSAMDGYALRASDTPGTLEIVADVPAGSPLHEVPPGTAATIMTGAPLPPGTDAVVPWEDAERGEGLVTVPVRARGGQYVRPRGEDVRAGAAVIGRGSVVRPVHLGVLASLGRTTVRVQRRPRVAVLSTGDELVAPGNPLRSGAVHDANRAFLRGLCEREGAEVVADALIADEPERIAGWLRDAADLADLIVTSGGASVGEHDWIREILEREGELSMWRVAIKPGKPVALGRVARTPVLGLPGNPGSAFVCAHVFVARAIRIMAGRAADPASRTAVLTDAIRGSTARTMFVPVTLDEARARPLPAHSSVVLSHLLDADAFALVPPGGLPAGAAVTVEPI